MPRLGTPDDAAKAVLNLIRGMNGEHPRTRGGSRKGGSTRKSAVKKRQLSSGSTPADGGVSSGGSGSTFTSPLTAAWSLIRGGAGGALVELPLGPEGTVLASMGGRLQWVYPSTLGVPVDYVTFMDGMDELDVTDADGVPLWA